MAIIPKQIGWSQESNLIWELLKQLDQLTKVTSTSGGGGGGGTNPTSTIIPYNNAGTFADSYLKNDTSNTLLKSIVGGSDIGLKLDFANDVFSLGDYAGVTYKTLLTVNNNSQSIYLDAQSIVEMGDSSGFNHGTKITVNDATKQVVINAGNGTNLNQGYITNVYTQSYIDATNGYVIDRPGVYHFTSAATNSSDPIVFPDPSTYIGSELFIIMDTSDDSYVFSGSAVKYVTQGVDGFITNLLAYYTYVFKAIGNPNNPVSCFWIGGPLGPI